MALLLSSSFAAPFAGLFDDNWGYGSPQAPMLMRCGAACAPPLGLLLAPRVRLPPATAYRLQRHASYAPPTEPEVHVRRTPEGVVAACPLGRGFSSQDISLQLSGRDFTITAFHPGTAHWRQRPAAYRRVLDLADHIDSQHIEAALERGVLTILFPYRRQQPRLAPMHIPPPAPVHHRPRLVFVHRAAAPATATAPVHAAAPVSARPSMQAAPATAAAPSACACAPPSSQTAAAPCSFRQAQHRGLQRWNTQHPMQRRCPEQALFGLFETPAPTPSSAQRHSPLTRHHQPTASPQRRAAPAAPAPARAPAVEPLLRPASPAQPITIPVEGPTPNSPTAEAPKEVVPVPAPAVEGEAAASPAAADTSKGKAAASPEQAAALERRQRAAVAQARITAGVGSDSDWEDADGMVSDCSLDN